jgi:hypothetical protein
MRSVWDPSPGPKTKPDSDKTSSPVPPSIQPRTSPASPPQKHSLGTLQQRKDDHAQRKRNRIVVCLLLMAPFNCLAVMYTMSKEKIEMRPTGSLRRLC